MADYAKYRESVGVENKQMTELLCQHFPNYSKIQSAMVNAPEKYGICLSPEAEAILVANFGPGPGLNSKTRRKTQVKRNKTNRMAVRLDDRSYNMVKIKMAQMGLKSAQDFLEIAIENMTKE